MKILLLCLVALMGGLHAEEYVLGPDSQRQPGVPQGSVTKYTWSASKLYPGTTRDYWVYVPKQYKAEKPACVMIFQDGGGYISDKGATRGPVVLDNLIAKGDMPVTIAIFINPGVMPALSASAQQDRYNRSLEYDGMGDRYARFLIEEILPEVRKQYNLSTNPDDYGIGGQSSGGIAAFTAAWERPDVFHRVLTFIGSFTNLRGGDVYPGLIRKTEPKPLRIFQQDGSNDQSIYSGSWFMANQDVAMALAYAGYDTKFVVGTEGHNMKQGGAILPDALRWLWRDYGKPIVASNGGKNRHTVAEILDPGKGWELVTSGYKMTDAPAVDKEGNVYFSDIPNSKIYKVSASDGKVAVFKDDQPASGLMFAADGTLYAAQNKSRRVVAFAPDGSMKVLADGVDANDLAVGPKGDVYFTDSPGKKVWRITPAGERKVVLEGLALPNGIRLSPDHSLLIVDDMNNRWAWSAQVQPDGSLKNAQAFYHLETTDENSMSGADGMTLDREGFLYVTTKLGIQICDQPGRVNAIISKPAARANHVAFGGPDMQWIYVTAGDKVFRRHLRRKGAFPWEPVKPPKPQL
jgi:sugar lactone lactonase YvrE/enterochelin esterase-like enzyme